MVEFQPNARVLAIITDAALFMKTFYYVKFESNGQNAKISKFLKSEDDFTIFQMSENVNRKR